MRKRIGEIKSFFLILFLFVPFYFPLFLFCLQLFLPFASNHTIKSDNDERDAEQLSHIERHRTLEVNLVFFEKFNEEPENEDGCKAEPEEESRTDFFLELAVKQQSNQEEHEVGYCLVELRWMPWRELPVDKSVVSVENESPRLVGRTAYDFRIHKIAKTYAASGYRRGYSNDI